MHNFVFAQEVEETGFLGDHFSLEAALEMFKRAENPEDFEKLLNQADNYVNNLDLNEDGEIDYIRVVNFYEDNTHLFVLQAVVSKDENQDIAVIELEKSENGEVILQIIGDEDIYGEEVIVEASQGENMIAEMSSQNQEYFDYKDANEANPVNVVSWPLVRYIYRPNYVVWNSPYRWRTYPTYWKSWRPLTWAVYQPFRVKHHHYGSRVVHKNRMARAHKVYSPHRSSSKIVISRTVERRGNQKVQKTKTKVTGPRGNSKTMKSTKAKGENGNVKVKRTTTTKRKKGN